MLVIKILEATLVAGQETVTFTDSEIPNSIISTNCSDPDLYPVSSTLSGNVLTLTYEKQSSDKYIAVTLLKQDLDIVDNVTSEDSNKALSAKQGKLLKDAIDSIVIPTVPENITDLDDVAISSIQNGQVLAWNITTEKFENVDQSGGGATVEDVSNLVTWKSGINLNAGSYKYAYKIGNLVFFYFQADMSSGYSPVGTSFQLFTLDNSIKPVAASASYCRGTGNAHAQLTASTAGAINVTCGNWGLGSLFWSIA